MKRNFLALFLLAFLCASCEDNTFIGFDYVAPTVEEEVEEEDAYPTLPNFTPEAHIIINNTESNIEKILPIEWGEIIGAEISAVPADDVNEPYAKKCMVLRTEYGAVATVFDMNEQLPAIEDILNGYFVEGNFGEEYNGGFFNNGNWEPAISVDMEDRIAYYQGDTCMRNLRFSTLRFWKWRDGNYSTVVENYNFNVKDGLLSVCYDGECIIQIR